MSSRNRRQSLFSSVSAEISTVVEKLEVRQVLSNGQMAIDILVPPTFLEGSAFAITAMDGIPGQMIRVQVIGDNNAMQYQFPSVRIDGNGNATLALRMPYVLARGFTVDGRTLRVTTDTYTNDFRVTLNAGQRVSLSTDNVQEGKPLTATLRSGTARSLVIFQLIRNNTEVVHEWGSMRTDSSGNGTYIVDIPAVLSRGRQGDNYGLRVISGGVVFDQKIAITAGTQVEIGAKNVRENSSVFSMNVHNARPNATVTLRWYLGTSQRTSQTFRVGSNGEGSFQVTTPSNLMSNSALQATFDLIVSLSGQPIPSGFPMVVYKRTQASPNPGGSQSTTFAPPMTSINSARGVAFHTPAAFGVKSVLPISKAENSILGQEDPAVTIQAWTSRQLVLLCYGSGQHPGGNEGMDVAYQKMQGFTGQSNVMRLFSGDKSLNPRQDLANANAATLAAEQAITDKINLLAGIGQNIQSVVIAGYSWGGGMAKELANWITNRYHHIEISGLMYVDAVNHGLIGHETRLPNPRPSSFLNIYQSLPWDLVDSVALGNGHISNYGLPVFDGRVLFGRYAEFDVDSHGNTASHTSIDDQMASGIAEFVDGILSGWYGMHPL